MVDYKDLKKLVNMDENKKRKFHMFKKKIVNAIKEIAKERINSKDWKIKKFKNKKYIKHTGSFVSGLENKYTNDIDIYVGVQSPTINDNKKLLAIFNGLESSIKNKLSVQIDLTSTKSSIDFIENEIIVSVIPVLINGNEQTRIYRATNEEPRTEKLNPEIEAAYNKCLSEITNKNTRKKHRINTKVIKALFKKQLGNLPSLILEQYYLEFINNEPDVSFSKFIKNTEIGKIKTFAINNLFLKDIALKKGASESFVQLKNKAKSISNHLDQGGHIETYFSRNVRN